MTLNTKARGNRREGHIMKVVILRLTLPASILAIVFSGLGHAEDTGAPAVSTRDFQAKIEYCKTCHGLSGQGYRGSFPMPRLAGQQTEYFENQLHAFIEHRRENRFMYAVSHVLSPATRTELAMHFKDLNPKPLGGAPREPVA